MYNTTSMYNTRRENKNTMSYFIKRHIPLWALLLAMALSCSRRGGETGSGSEADDSLAIPSASYISDVYDQGRTEACWVYAFCACVEQEAALRGDSLLLSRQWLMAHLMEEQTLERYEILSGGDELTDGGRGTIAMRGVGPDAERLIENYGLVPYQQERSRINSSRVLERKLRLMADDAVARRQTRAQLQERIETLMPRFTVARHMKLTHDVEDGEGESFYYLSMRYTPQQFAESVMYYQRWHWYASEQTHPWNESFALEVPDNRRYCEYVNKPMKEILQMVRESLQEGHAVYWEYGKEPSAQKGGGGASSDHAMAIVGLHEGGFVCRNSYGSNWGSNGYCLVTEDFFMKHTCSVGIVEIIE